MEALQQSFYGKTKADITRTDSHLILSNIGDSHAVLCCPFAQYALPNKSENSHEVSYSTEDHRISNYQSHKLPDFKLFSHFIADNRLNGSLQLSRSIGKQTHILLGDFRFKPLISSEPYFIALPRSVNTYIIRKDIPSIYDNSNRWIMGRCKQ